MRHPHSSDPETHDPKTNDLKTRNPKTSYPKKARVREARIQEARVREARIQEATKTRSKTSTNKCFACWGFMKWSPSCLCMYVNTYVCIHTRQHPRINLHLQAMHIHMRTYRVRKEGLWNLARKTPAQTNKSHIHSLKSKFLLLYSNRIT